MLRGPSAHEVVFPHYTIDDKSYSLLRMCVILWDENLRNLKVMEATAFLWLCLYLCYVYTYACTNSMQ